MVVHSVAVPAIISNHVTIYSIKVNKIKLNIKVEWNLRNLHYTVLIMGGSPTLLSLFIRHRIFTYITWLTYVTAHSKTSLALPTSQLILQPFRCYTYVTAHSPTLLWLLLRHRIFTYVT